jgi:hypothetical protein
MVTALLVALQAMLRPGQGQTSTREGEPDTAGRPAASSSQLPSGLLMMRWPLASCGQQVAGRRRGWLHELGPWPPAA